MRYIGGLALAGLLSLSAGVQAQGEPQERAQNPSSARAELAMTLQRSIAIEREAPVTRVPLIPFMGKYEIDASINGDLRRFIFDTGSPTMISRELASELDLKVIGSNTGRDANGRAVTTDIAVADTLVIGGVTFRSVPVLIADFRAIDPDGCFIKHGVIGSEIFPGSAWHISAVTDTLQIAETRADLEIADTEGIALGSPLYDFGYPHAPIFEYGFGDFSDKALFDTGSSDTIVLFERVMAEARANKAIAAGSLREGFGSHGVSAGGAGENTRLLRFTVDRFRFGETKLEALPGTTRTAPPSLIGLGILRTHSVTLDYPGSRMMLHPRSEPGEAPAPAGYSLRVKDGEARVVQLFEGSAAALVGLKLGDHVAAIMGRDLTAPSSPCETENWLSETRPTRSATSLTVLRDGERVVIDWSLIDLEGE